MDLGAVLGVLNRRPSSKTKAACHRLHRTRFFYHSLCINLSFVFLYFYFYLLLKHWNHPLQRIQEIERRVWYSILWQRAWNSAGYVDCLQLLSHHLADAFLQPICLFCRKDALHQKLFAFGRRHLLQQRPRVAVLRFIEVRAENILRSFHTSVLYQQTAIEDLESIF